jgi:hypothetical protein
MAFNIKKWGNKVMPGVRQAGTTIIGGAQGGLPGALAGYTVTNRKFMNAGQNQQGVPQGAADGGGGFGYPQLSPWAGISSLGEEGLIKPKTLTGQDIQTQMEESPWYKMALEKQGAEQAQLIDQAARQQAGALAGARSQLAMKGGLRGGASERLAASGAENLANLLQQQRQAGAIERGQLGMQGADIASRLGQFNIGAENLAQAQNVQNRMTDLQAQNARNVMEYQEQMKMRGAEATAEGIRKSGGGKGFLQDPAGATRATFKKFGF